MRRDRIAAGATSDGATPAGILASDHRANFQSKGKPSPLWAKVLAAASVLTPDDAERALLARTRLAAVNGKQFVVALLGEPCDAAQGERLGQLLNTALARVGLGYFTVRFGPDPHP